MTERYAPLELSRSLTCLPDAIQRAAGPTRRGMRPEAGFLTQLLAVRHDSPEYRIRRRAAPEHALQAYGVRPPPTMTHCRMNIAA